VVALPPAPLDWRQLPLGIGEVFLNWTRPGFRYILLDRPSQDVFSPISAVFSPVLSLASFYFEVPLLGPLLMGFLRSAG